MKIPHVIAAATCILVLGVLISGCTSPQPGGIVLTESPMITTASALSCGFTSCHGLDLACSPNPPQVCTAIYQLGDKCRQYAYCSTNGSSCALVRTPQFDTCKSCTDKCGGADPAGKFSCEEKC